MKVIAKKNIKQRDWQFVYRANKNHVKNRIFLIKNNINIKNMNL